jgi:hypothetical protein
MKPEREERPAQADASITDDHHTGMKQRFDPSLAVVFLVARPLRFHVWPRRRLGVDPVLADAQRNLALATQARGQARARR